MGLISQVALHVFYCNWFFTGDLLMPGFASSSAYWREGACKIM